MKGRGVTAAQATPGTFLPVLVEMELLQQLFTITNFGSSSYLCAPILASSSLITVESWSLEAEGKDPLIRNKTSLDLLEKLLELL